MTDALQMVERFRFAAKYRMTMDYGAGVMLVEAADALEAAHEYIACKDAHTKVLQDPKTTTEHVLDSRDAMFAAERAMREALKGATP